MPLPCVITWGPYLLPGTSAYCPDLFPSALNKYCVHTPGVLTKLEVHLPSADSSTYQLVLNWCQILSVISLVFSTELRFASERQFYSILR